jgi:hypothetical protein
MSKCSLVWRPLFSLLLLCLVSPVFLATAQDRVIPFSAGGTLNREYWETSTPMLATLAHVEGETNWVAPRLSFETVGMRMSGVNGTYQFTGIQSRISFSPPFAFRTTVMGIDAHGNAFGIYLVGKNLAETLKIEGNLNSRNGPYYGLSVTPGTNPGENIRQGVSIGQWYKVTVAVEADGVGTVTITQTNGSTLFTKRGLPVGIGPFYIVLGQREGAPYAVGPNTAIWSSFEQLSLSAANSSSQETQKPLAENAAEYGGAPEIWLGFANGNVAQDRDTELFHNCGSFKRIYVPSSAGNKFTDLCAYIGKKCESICDWEGRRLACSSVSLGGNRDGTRVTLCH